VLPWQTLESVKTPEGNLELRQRGERDFLITIGGRVLMTSAAHRSEDELAELACAALPGKVQPRVLLGGLGMGFTLRRALDKLPPPARITVVDLNAQVVAWNRGPLSVLTRGASDDPRVKIVVGNVAQTIARAPAGHFDAIVIDLYEGPHAAISRDRDPLYGSEALERTLAALRPGGVFAVWSEERDKPFEDRLAAAGFAVERHHGSQGGRIHVVYIAIAQQARAETQVPSGKAKPASQPTLQPKLQPKLFRKAHHRDGKHGQRDARVRAKRK
jgi:spermidine synthase